MRTVLPLLILLLCSNAATAANPAKPTSQWKYHDQDLTLNLRARSPEQIAAFYAARKFPAEMVELLSGLCFITTRVTNNRDEVLWLQLDRWRFHTPDTDTDADSDIERHDRVWLAGQLDTIDAPAASRSILRWTLLPEQLDFRPGEQEGGNILLTRTATPFSLEAVFRLGPHADGREITVTIDNLRCAENLQ